MTLRLRGGGVPIELLAAGVRHPRSARFGGDVFTRYEDVTHVVSGPGGVRIGARRGSYLFRSAEFAERGGHQELARALRERIAALPGGPEQLERMGRLDALLARPGAVPVTAALGVVCVLVFGLQIVSPSSYDAGFFSAMLVGLGEPWRLVTANFLHASPGHLALNGVGLVVLGTLAERSLGSRALGPVVALAGLGAMAASYAAGYQRALGASGLVTGLAGALLWLEFRAPEALPATWRIPRRLFVGLIALETLGLLALPGIAHAAHAGGLAAGALAAAAVGPRLRDAGGPRPGLAVLNALALAATLLAGISFARAVYAPDADAIARRGEGLLALADVPVDFLNNEAWRIAVSKHPRPEALDVARRMAERAAAETGWAAPAILDTLAEIHFLSGRPELAREIEGAAVALAPDEPYYREQLRRFGEPPEGERPDAPGGGGPEPRRPEPRRSPPAEPGPGVRV